MEPESPDPLANGSRDSSESQNQTQQHTTQATRQFPTRHQPSRNPPVPPILSLDTHLGGTQSVPSAPPLNGQPTIPPALSTPAAVLDDALSQIMRRLAVLQNTINTVQQENLNLREDLARRSTILLKIGML